MSKNKFFIIMMMVWMNAKPLIAEPNRIAVIPQPAQMKIIEGFFQIKDQTVILCGGDTNDIGRYLADRLKPVTGYTLNVLPLVKKTNGGLDNSIQFELSPDRFELNDEGYEIKVFPGHIEVQAAKKAGLFYACQTIRQLLPLQIESEKKVKDVLWKIPCLEMLDKPRFKWRGMHLDVCRHFFDKEFVKKYIDILAYHKMNRFHWHLTEDQGWRIAIKKYPKLTEVGAWRNEKYAKQYGGFYTQDDIREVVEYAQSRFVTVVPEIEMPGHCRAALAAYPELSCTGGPFEVWHRWGVCKDVFCAGNDKTFEFLQNVLTEVCELFPSAYIHIGGDEVPKDNWKACDKCQQRIADANLADTNELQSYFIKRISAFLKNKDRKLIGWDEIIEGGLPQGATVMCWRGVQKGVEAAEAGHDVIMTPTFPCYFNFKQSHSKNDPGWFIKPNLLQDVYQFEPIPDTLNPECAKHILGAQGNVWSEGILIEQQVEYQALPRMCALAEVVWSPAEKKNWDDFSERLKQHGDRMERMDIHFYHAPEIWPGN